MSRGGAIRQLILGPARASVVRTAYQLARGRRMVVGQRFAVRARRGSITVTDGLLALGVNHYGFLDSRVSGLLRVDGTLRVVGGVAISGGNRWDIGKDATVEISGPATISPFGRLIATDSIVIGGPAMVGWDVQLLDSDFHPSRVSKDEPFRYAETGIQIGSHVWIGSRATILGGTTIADGCIVAAGAVVRGRFTEPNCLIGGVPGKVIKRGVEWTEPSLNEDIGPICDS